jgi:ParB family chromosome partitioning protein
MTIAVEKAVENPPDKPGEKRRALGRGLDSLLPGPRAVTPAANAAPMPPNAPASVAAEPAPSINGVQMIELERIEANPYQTRRAFDETALNELADSIRANGVMQPVVVRPAKNGKYTLVLGERRCRASKLAGLTAVPAIVRTVSEQQAAEMTVIENLQRQDLNCMEQANAFLRLSHDFHLTQDEIGKRTGMSRESVSNYMRLRRLPDQVRVYLLEGDLGFSEAKVLMQLEDPDVMEQVAREAVERMLSVAQLRELVEATNHPAQEKKGGGARWQDPNVRAAQDRIERTLGVRVRISDRQGKGKITIEYETLEDFDRLLEMLEGK